jgi:hypothetical protein
MLTPPSAGLGSLVRVVLDTNAALLFTGISGNLVSLWQNGSKVLTVPREGSPCLCVFWEGMVRVNTFAICRRRG